MEPADNFRKAEDKMVECFLIAQNHFNRTFNLPQIVFDLIGRCAGYAYYSENKIRINPILLNQNSEVVINNTVPHEAAHLIAVTVFGIGARGHGFYWKKIMRNVFNLVPDRCHKLDVSKSLGKTIKRHVYFCPTCQKELVLSTTRHNQINNFESIRHVICQRALLISDYKSTTVLDKAANLT
jgi:SprT protein